MGTKRELKRTGKLERLPGGLVKDLGLSVKAGKRIEAEPQECYWNARRAVYLNAVGGGARYVEGVAVMNMAPITFEHGWVELEDGTIVDPTLPDEGYLYFGAFSYEWDDARDFAYDHPGVGPMWTIRFGLFGVYGERDYQKASVRAQLAAGYPPVMVMAQGRKIETAVMLVFQEEGIDFDPDQAATIAAFLDTGKLNPVQLQRANGGE